MKCIIISDRQPEFFSALKEALDYARVTNGFSRYTTTDETLSDYKNNTDDTFVLVDIDSQADRQSLANIHVRFPGAPIICFSENDTLETRTLITFGGADSAMRVKDNYTPLVQKGIKLTEKGKTNFREPIGMTFVAGNILINTELGSFVRLPSGFKNAAQAAMEMPHRISPPDSLQAPPARGTLSKNQCAVLEALAHADKPLTPEELADIVYKPHRRPKSNRTPTLLKAIARAFSGDDKLLNSEQISEFRSAGIEPPKFLEATQDALIIEEDSGSAALQVSYTALSSRDIN